MLYKQNRRKFRRFISVYFAIILLLFCYYFAIVLLLFCYCFAIVRYCFAIVRYCFVIVLLLFVCCRVFTLYSYFFFRLFLFNAVRCPPFPP